MFPSTMNTSSGRFEILARSYVVHLWETDVHDTKMSSPSIRVSLPVLSDALRVHTSDARVISLKFLCAKQDGPFVPAHC